MRKKRRGGDEDEDDEAGGKGERGGKEGRGRREGARSDSQDIEFVVLSLRKWADLNGEDLFLLLIN